MEVTEKEKILAILKDAVNCQNAGKLQEAERLCTLIRSVVPNQPDALNLLAIINAQFRRYEAANDYFKQAISAAPGRADVYGNYGNALLEQGAFDEAINTCRRSLALDSGRAEVHNILGNALLCKNQLEAAAASFRKALDICPDYPHAHNNLGIALQRTGRTEEAISAYRRALELRANYPEAWNNLGQVLKNAGKIEEAANCFRKAVEIRPDFRKASLNFAEVDPIWLEPLDGKRLWLRRYRKEDASYLRRCYLNFDFITQYNHYVPRHLSVEELEANLRIASEKHPCQLKSVDWIIIRKDTEKPIGIANLADIQFAHRRAEYLIGIPDRADIRNGIGVEATLLVMDFAFNKVGLNKVTSIVYEHNTQAQKSTLALGFVQESYLREQTMNHDGGRFVDLYGNGMTKRDFRLNERLAKLSQRMLGRNITNAS